MQTHNQQPRDFFLVDKLNKSYNGIKVLTDVSFSIAQSSIISIVGSNGSGKSTLLRSLIRLIEPDNGNIYYDGKCIVSAKRKELRKIRSEIGFVFQKHNLVSKLSVLTNVIHGSLARKSGPRHWYQSLSPKQYRDEAMQCLKAVGLENYAQRKTNEISGGQSQRVAIARALMQKPKILLADEPVASLDPKNGESVMELFYQLAKEQNITLVFISHNVEHALKYSDRVIGLNQGAITIDKASSLCCEDEIGYIYG